jgi:CarD family transcriptional regulator
MTFLVGDKAVHPAHGVGEITAIETREIAGKKTSFYILRVLDESDTKVMVPVDAATRIRPVISKREVKKVIDTLKKDEIAVKAQPWNRRHREYDAMLNSGSLVEVAKVYRDLNRLKAGKELSFGERKLLDHARTLLVTELALARKCAESRVESDLAGLFG